MSTAPQSIKDIIDPRQLRAIAFYRNPKSDTFGNLRGSAIIAGYSEQYADNLTQFKPAWLTLSAQKDVARVEKAEAYLDEVQGLDIHIMGSSMVDIDVARLKLDVTRLVLKTLAKAKYSEDEEKTPPTVHINLINYNESIDESSLPIKEAQIVEHNTDTPLN